MNNELDEKENSTIDFLEVVRNYLTTDEFRAAANNVKLKLQKLGEFAYKFYTYSQHQKKMYIEMSLFGWFPSYITFTKPVLDGETADDYMDRCLTQNYDDIKDIIIESYPHRKHIFEEAFKLYEEGRFISSIPLFLSQLDGLSAEYGLSPFFTNTKLSNAEKKNLSADEQLKLDKFPIFLKKALEQKLLGQSQEIISYYEEVISNACDSFIGKNTEKLDLNNPINSLNRHGILHGHIEFLQYADRKNCLKIISLILFVDHMLKLLYGNFEQADKTENETVNKTV